MAIFTSAIFSSIRNKLGSNVLYRTKGENIIRTYNASPTDPRTPAQLRRRSGFSVLSTFYNTHKTTLNRLINKLPSKTNPYSYFFKQNINKALDYSSNPATIIYNNLTLGFGTLDTPSINRRPNGNEPNFTCNFGNISDYNNGEEITGLFLVLLYPSTGEFTLFPSSVPGNGSLAFNLPWAFFADTQNLYIYVFFTNNSDSNNFTNNSIPVFLAYVNRPN